MATRGDHVAPSRALPSLPTTVVLVGEQLASHGRGADFPLSQRLLELTLVSVPSDVAGPGFIPTMLPEEGPSSMFSITGSLPCSR